MSDAQIIEADFTWVDGAMASGVQIEVDDSGRIVAVGELKKPTTHRLQGRALTPGFVNAHSHAFQRGLRGKTERFGASSGTFWSWREEMYSLVQTLDADRIYELSLLAFREMLAAGITCVGEFHYVRHAPGCGDFSLDEAVVRAASDSGIRLALLLVYYNTGGIGQPLDAAQKQFATSSPSEYWKQFDRVAAMLDSSTQTIGAVAHSIRAATMADIAELHAESRARGVVFHIHVEEQRREIEDCVELYGQPPMSILLDRLEIDERFTAVHCTHTDPLDMELFIGRGANVCLCPVTEANLGDGVADVPGMLADDAHICIGTDSNSRLCMAEELRMLEYVQRLTEERRGVILDEAGACGMRLLGFGTEAGARSLGVAAGAITPGCWADFAVVDLESQALVGWTPETLLDAFLFGAGREAIAGVCVGGQWMETVHGD